MSFPNNISEREVDLENGSPVILKIFFTIAYDDAISKVILRRRVKTPTVSRFSPSVATACGRRPPAAHNAPVAVS